jgi:hypothetical protein
MSRDTLYNSNECLAFFFVADLLCWQVEEATNVLSPDLEDLQPFSISL